MFSEIKFRDFRQQYPGFLPGVFLILGVILATDSLLMERRRNYDRQIEELRARMTDVQRSTGDALLDSRDAQQKMILELVRRQAKWGQPLHLSLDVDSAKMFLMQESAVLRAFPVELGVQRSLRSRGERERANVIRGADTVRAVLGPNDPWPVPRWVYLDRRLPVPPDTMLAGALGPVALVLTSGTVIYSMPAAGPLKDSLYVLPGGVRAREDDLRAVAPNLVPGTPVYIY